MATVATLATTPASEGQATAGDAPKPVVAATQTATDAQPAGGDVARPQADATSPAPTRAHDATPRARDAAPLAAPDQPTAVPRVETAAMTAAEPTVAVRRREPARLPADPVADGRHAATAEAVSMTPRPAASASTPPSDATAAYRHAEAPTLPELPRPLGRLPDGGEMRLEVTPEGLGPIEIRVAVRADAVQASLWTQQDHARAALEAHRPMLADALERSSLRLEEFTVGVGQHHHGGRDDDRTPPRWSNPLVTEPVSASAPAQAPGRPRGLSLRA